MQLNKFLSFSKTKLQKKTSILYKIKSKATSIKTGFSKSFSSTPVTAIWDYENAKLTNEYDINDLTKIWKRRATCRWCTQIYLPLGIKFVRIQRENIQCQANKKQDDCYKFVLVGENSNQKKNLNLMFFNCFFSFLNCVFLLFFWQKNYKNNRY